MGAPLGPGGNNGPTPAGAARGAPRGGALVNDRKRTR